MEDFNCKKNNNNSKPPGIILAYFTHVAKSYDLYTGPRTFYCSLREPISTEMVIVTE